ncbi:MAG: DUF3047 domain-containing protein [Deltaproteobacteria bacterium]|nr:DUF3047 domain-containing protein [Deltaproteobacteria bacterium]
MKFNNIKNLKPAFLTLACLATLLFYLAFTASSTAENRITIPIEKSASGIPDGWELKEWKGTAQFEVVDTEAGKTIHLKSSSTSSALYREVKFDIREYPYISWKWKVTKIPEGADVRKKSTDDQAAQVYVIFPKFPAVVNSRLVGYIWDTGAPQGSTVTSTKTSNTRYVVIRSGSAGLGEWFTEKRNVYEDYKRLFGEEPPSVGKVSVMIDSDDTKSTAESYIGDIYFSKE